MDFPFLPAKHIDDITYRTAAAAGNGLFVASCQNLVLSTNLESWDTVLSNFSGSLAQLGFTDGLFMGLLWWGDMITSSDGWTWDYHLAPEEFPFSNMRRENGRFVSFRPGASDGSYAPALAVSQDGFDWSVTSMPEYTNSQILASSANTFFLLNTRSNGFYSSLDGISWQARTFGTNVAIADIVFGNGTYVAVGDGCILQSAPDTNAPPPMTPTIAVQSVPGITITGTVGWNYRIEYAENLENTNSFLPLTNLCLPSSPFMWVDTAAAGQPRRFYRATIAP